jgi:hypothetical protein
VTKAQAIIDKTSSTSRPSRQAVIKPEIYQAGQGLKPHDRPNSEKEGLAFP